ncbi:hypothetical protein [Pollutimonas sp. M17]|uniref:hypothetical protein n=1 Tax=Pollutimonas sp. M17 TaxID=2962065 RepID=UPI0021F4ECDC|nr:hypothetical protein [Pollutimonas sp. M17]UYO93543.1 hypothetical protein OEG81_16960 [Pollutimonas sp. M17]HWK71647.1 hypothetical protein [Burkholderiaceae bacterium]
MVTKDDRAAPDIMADSYRRETTRKERDKNTKSIKEGQRSLVNAPVDPNSPTTRINFPPGVEPEDAADPGRATPGAPPVENQSGKGPGRK